MENFLGVLIALAVGLGGLLGALLTHKKKEDYQTEIEYIPLPPELPKPMETPEVNSEVTTEPNPDELLPWIFGESLTHNNWHNVRAICDLEGLSFEMKEELCATVWAESEFNTNARLDNRDKHGNTWSTDWGICQWNSYWHSKEITPTECVNDPEKAIRLMCKYFKTGQANAWVAHSSGAYKKYLGKKL